MRLIISTFAFVGCVAACTTSTSETTTDSQALETSSPSVARYDPWLGDFVATRARDEAFPGRLRGLSLAVDPARPADGGTYRIYYRSGQRVDGTFVWSGPVTSSRAGVVLHSDSSPYDRELTLSRRLGGHAVQTRGLDSAADPTGEAYDTIVEPLRPGLCSEYPCVPFYETCNDAAFEPDAPVLTHACVTLADVLVPFEL
jgi:hypothetical protein